MLQRTLVGGIALLIAVPGQAASDPLAAVLEAKTQALLDAIAPGEKGLWNAALAPSHGYVFVAYATLAVAVGPVDRAGLVIAPGSRMSPCSSQASARVISVGSRSCDNPVPRRA